MIAKLFFVMTILFLLVSSSWALDGDDPADGREQELPSEQINRAARRQAEIAEGKSSSRSINAMMLQKVSMQRGDYITYTERDEPLQWDEYLERKQQKFSQRATEDHDRLRRLVQ